MIVADAFLAIIPGRGTRHAASGEL